MIRIDRVTAGNLALHNGGELSLYFIGTGSAFSKTMNQNNVLVVKGSEHLIIDCGTKTLQALHDMGMQAYEPRNFLITHSHADHIGGLEEVMMVNRYGVHRKPNIIINEAYQDILWNQSLRGGSAYSELHDGHPLGFEDFWNPLRPHLLDAMPRETWAYTLGELDIRMPRTMHFPDNAASWEDSFWSCSVILDRRIFFTSDTRFDPELLRDFDRLYDFEVIFHDCQLYSGGVHTSFKELSELPSKLRAKIILMHYGDNWREFTRAAQEAGFRSFAQQSFRYVFDDTDER